jgi:hypothetical protein
LRNGVLVICCSAGSNPAAAAEQPMSLVADVGFTRAGRWRFWRLTGTERPDLIEGASGRSTSV